LWGKKLKMILTRVALGTAGRDGTDTQRRLKTIEKGKPWASLEKAPAPFILYKKKQ